jgi:hypothetical protein
MMPVPGLAERAATRLAGAMTALDVVMQGAARAQRHEDQVALGDLGRLADRFRHFTRLAVAEADAALLVANDHESGEAEAATTLHDLGNAIDVNELVDELAVALFALAAGRDRRPYVPVPYPVLIFFRKHGLMIADPYPRSIAEFNW